MKFNREFKYQTRIVADGTNRTEGYLCVPEMETALGRKGMMVRGPSMWNTMTEKLKTFNGNISSFKKDIKK